MSRTPLFDLHIRAQAHTHARACACTHTHIRSSKYKKGRGGGDGGGGGGRGKITQKCTVHVKRVFFLRLTHSKNLNENLADSECLECNDPGVVTGNVMIAGRAAEMSWPWLLSVYISNIMALFLFYYCIGASKFIVNMWGLRMTSQATLPIAGGS